MHEPEWNPGLGGAHCRAMRVAVIGTAARPGSLLPKQCNDKAL